MRHSLAILGILLCGAQDDSARARELVEKFRSEKIEERDEAARKLKELGRKALPELEKAAKHDDAEVRKRAEHLLRAIPISEKLTPNLKKAMPGVEDRLASPDEHAWTEVLLEALDAHGKTLTADDLDLLSAKALRGARSAEERRRLCSSAGERGWRSAIPELIVHLQGPDMVACQSAMESLAKLTARSAWPHLVRLIDHQDGFIGDRAAAALRNLQVHEAIPDVTKLLRDRRPDVRRRAVDLLYHLQMTVLAPEPELISEVALLLADEDALVRASALDTLGGLGERSMAGKIVALLKDPAPWVREHACLALGELDAREAAVEVFPLLEDRDPRVRSRAAHCLGRLKAKNAGRDLVHLLKDKDAEARKGAVEGLGLLGFRDAILDVTALAKDPESWVRWRAIQALGRLKARESIREIIAAVKDENIQVRSQAVEALGTLASKEAVPVLLACLRDGKSGIQADAVEVLGQMDVREAVPAIAPLLRHPEQRVRIEAAAWLCHLGSKEGVPVLLKESRSLIFLNALRRPELWNQLRAGPVVEDVVGTWKDMVGRTAEKAGIALEWSPESLKDLGRGIVGSRRPRDPEDRCTLLQTLINSTHNYSHSDTESVLEQDRISVLSSRDALAFWSRWWSEEKK